MLIPTKVTLLAALLTAVRIRLSSQYTSWNGDMALGRKVRMHDLSSTYYCHVHWVYKCDRKMSRLIASDLQETILWKQKRRSNFIPRSSVTMAQYFNQQPQGAKNRIENVAIVGVRDIQVQQSSHNVLTLSTGRRSSRIIHHSCSAGHRQAQPHRHHPRREQFDSARRRHQAQRRL